MGLRNTLLGTGLLGILGVQEVQAAENYNSLSWEEVNSLIRSRTEIMNYESVKDIQDQKIDWDGLILYSSTCPKGESTVNINRNMEIVFLQLMDTFAYMQMPDKDKIHFGYFNLCGERRALEELDVTTIETHMYLDGKEIDRMRGGPTTERGMKATLNNMGLWIEYTLLGIRELEDRDKDVVILYKGDSSPEIYSS